MSEIDTVIDCIKQYRYSFGTAEKSLQEGLELALGPTTIREYPLPPHGIVDFFALSKIAVEVKVRGARNAVLRQLARYATHTSVEGIVLVTTRSVLRAMPKDICGKPLAVVYVGGFF